MQALCRGYFLEFLTLAGMRVHILKLLILPKAMVETGSFIPCELLLQHGVSFPGVTLNWLCYVVDNGKFMSEGHPVVTLRFATDKEIEKYCKSVE